MPKDELVYLRHMLEQAKSACAKLAGLDRAQFDQDENLRLALTYQLQVIGEAARRVSPECQARHHHIPLRQIIGMRHRVVHEYLAVDQGMVWSTVRQDLPGLIRDLEAILA